MGMATAPPWTRPATRSPSLPTRTPRTPPACTPVGWGSAYNAAREGFVFSDGACFGVPADDPEAAAEFERSMGAMFARPSAAARQVLAALERRLELRAGLVPGQLGPIGDHSQWHVKRYRPEARSEQRSLRRVHTDPSLIRRSTHDAPGGPHRPERAASSSTTPTPRAEGQRKKRCGGGVDRGITATVCSPSFTGSVLTESPAAHTQRRGTG